MKIFEVTKPKKLKESKASDLVALLAVVKQKKSAADADETGVAPASTDAGGGSTASTVEAIEEQIYSGEAQLCKDIDAELGKTGADPQDLHITIMSKVQEAGRNAAQQIVQQRGVRGAQAQDIIERVSLRVQVAAFGYINKKYNNGDDRNYRGNTVDIVRQALQGQQPRGGAQPIGQQSSARATGQQGTVPSGGGTNALDAMAADRARDADW